ncbi:MAG: C40 family peptidase [Microscillaceae bacterium]|nr:C40 family peptidase [Microscillaceae bacterium]
MVPVRTEPADRSELCTQLLFGDAYSVMALSPDEKWLHIRIAADDYTGWIDRGQHLAISEATYRILCAQQLPFVVEAASRLHQPQTGASQWLCRGSYLPFLAGPGLLGPDVPPWQWEAPFSPSPQTLSQKTLRHWAESYQYSPYLWGGKSPWGIDCSGFTQMVFRMSGFTLWRDARQQATQGQEIPIKEAQTGDLAFLPAREKWCTWA